MSLSRTQRRVFTILEVRKILVSLKSRKKFFFSFLPVKLNAFVIVKQKLIVKQKKTQIGQIIFELQCPPNLKILVPRKTR